ncbi:MAG: GerMN domain-containing protein [Bacillota bacterium]
MKPNYGNSKIAKYLVIGILLLLVVLAGCNMSLESKGKNSPSPVTNNQKEQAEKRSIQTNTTSDGVTVYFATREGNNMVPVMLPVNPTKDSARIAVEKLLAGPPDQFLQRTVPEETKLLDMYRVERTAYLDLTGEIKNVRSQEEALRAVNSLVLTATEFPAVDSVMLTIDGKAVKELAGIDISHLFPRPETINYLHQEKGKSKAKVYFADSNAMYLIPVTVDLAAESDDLEGMAREIVETLLKGPTANGLFRTVWPGTRLIGLQINGDQVVINFSKDVIGYGGGSAAETMLIDSLLFSLTDLSGINKVQLLIEGQKLEYLPEGIPIGEPMVRPPRLNWSER